MVVVGQLALGVVVIGQLAVGVGWSMGQLGLAATSGPGFVLGLFGRLYALPLTGSRRPEPRFIRYPRWGPTWAVVAAVVVLGLAVLWWFVAGRPLVDALNRTGGDLVDGPPPLR